MRVCDFCGNSFEGLPHRCKYCGNFHCTKHLIPEEHDCHGLKAIPKNFGWGWLRNNKSKKHQSNKISYKPSKSTPQEQVYKRESSRNYVGKDRVVPTIKEIAKWGITSFIAILISNYIVTQLAIINNLLIILLTAAIISILIQAVRSHYNEFSFKMRWFVFYFLVYAVIILFLREYVLSGKVSTTSILSSIIISLIISIIILVVQKIGIKSHTIPWISVLLFALLVVANLGYLQNLLQIDLQIGNKNISTISENKQGCPTPLTVGVLASESDFKSDWKSKANILQSLTDGSVWRIEHDFDSCYLGKYQGQYPNWVYCDNLIVSRWETGSSGTINYRWYTAVSAEWKPQIVGSSTYVFADFSCENGQKVTVTKGTTNYYVYDARDGSTIKIAY